MPILDVDSFALTHPVHDPARVFDAIYAHNSRNISPYTLEDASQVMKFMRVTTSELTDVFRALKVKGATC